MSRSIFQNLPEAQQLLGLTTEELAGYVLEHFHSLNLGQRQQAMAYNLANDISSRYEPRKEDVYRAISIACQWLINKGFLVPIGPQGILEVTDEGRHTTTATDLRSYLTPIQTPPRETQLSDRPSASQVSENSPEAEPTGQTDLKRANKLYEKVKRLFDETQNLDEKTAKLIVESARDAIKEFGSTNQEKKVELRHLKARAESVLPPKTFKELETRAVGEYLRRLYPRSAVLRGLLLGIIGLGVIASILFGFHKTFLGGRVDSRLPISSTPSPTSVETSSRVWQPAQLKGKITTETVLKASWFDIGWSDYDGWLSGATQIGGARGTVGIGILLHTINGGNSWTEIDKSIFPSGQGNFSWGPDVLWSWTEVGPITAFSAYPRAVGSGKVTTEAWLASSTGMYFSDDDGVKWERMTPPPNDTDRYALFSDFVGVEGNFEIYAVGWQGIAHWSKIGQRWDLQMATSDYPISAISLIGGSADRSVWAVGRAGVDEQGNTGSKSHGAIYHLIWPENKWEQVPLPGISFRTAQNLNGIVIPNYYTVFAVGDLGLVIRGSLVNGKWAWAKVEAPTEVSLNSIAYSKEGSLWIVGEDGVILESKDNGKTWAHTVIRDAEGKTHKLQRIRFFGDAGWIVGEQVVLNSLSR